MTCGTCTFCCRAMAVVELSKPVDQWCEFTRAHKGCSIYDERPPSCRDFQCYWLATQSNDDPKVRMPLEFRPDKSRCMITDHYPDKVVCKVDPREPLAFRKQPMWTFLYSRALTAQVYVIAGTRVFQIFPPHMGVVGGFEELPRERVRIRGNDIDIVVM